MEKRGQNEKMKFQGQNKKAKEQEVGVYKQNLKVCIRPLKQQLSDHHQIKMRTSIKGTS